MEHVWVFLVLALIVSLAQALIIADLYYAKKRLARVESLVTLYAGQMNDAVSSMDAPTRARYNQARAARHIAAKGV